VIIHSVLDLALHQMFVIAMLRVASLPGMIGDDQVLHQVQRPAQVDHGSGMLSSACFHSASFAAQYGHLGQPWMRWRPFIHDCLKF